MPPAVTFSVVIPCYNYGRFLARAVDSVLAQARDDVEIIVVDDASDDDTPQVAAHYGDRLRYHRCEQNLGAAGAWALGLTLAGGDYLCKLDADDEQLPGFLDAVAAAFARDPNIGFVAATAVQRRDGRDVLTQSLATSDSVLDAATLRGLLLREFFFRMPGSALRRAALANHDPPVPELYQLHDWEYFLRVTQDWGGCLIAQPLAVYHLHGDSITATARHRGRLEGDIARWMELADGGGDCGLDPSESAWLKGSLAILLARGATPGTAALLSADTARALLAAGRIASRGGVGQLLRLAGFVLAKGGAAVTRTLHRGAAIGGRLWRWGARRLGRLVALTRDGGVLAGLRYVREELLRNTWITLTRGRQQPAGETRRECNICAWRGPRFLTHCGAGYMVTDSVCPGCRSFPRHRGFALLLESRLASELGAIDTQPGLRLMFAPEPSMSDLLGRHLHDLVGVDASPVNDLVDARMDIQQLALADGSVAFLSCFHVIEHVPRDRQALAELCRVLTDGGRAVVCVPVNFSRSVTLEFGAPNPLLEHHYYDYAPDFGQRVAEAAFDGRVYRLSQIIAADTFERLRLQDELIFWVWRAPVPGGEGIRDSSGALAYPAPAAATVEADGAS